MERFADMLVSYWTKNLNWYAETTHRIRLEYAKKWGHQYVVNTSELDKSRAPQWHKIRSILHAFDCGDEWVYWQDADSIFMPWADDFFNFIDDDCELKITRNYIDTKTEFGCNSGDIFIRNTSFTRSLLKSVWNDPFFHNREYWEQSVLDIKLKPYIINKDKRVSFFEPLSYNQLLRYDTRYRSQVFHAICCSALPEELNKVLDLFYQGYGPVSPVCIDMHTRNLILSCIDFHQPFYKTSIKANSYEIII